MMLPKGCAETKRNETVGLAFHEKYSSTRFGLELRGAWAPTTFSDSWFSKKRAYAITLSCCGLDPL